MKKNVGKTCPVCKKTFVESDDIVVCPECGTPHHRSCYASIGCCALSSEHGRMKKEETEKQNKKDFASQKTDNKETEYISCLVCGLQNPKDALFCAGCGHPIGKDVQNGAQNGYSNGKPSVALKNNMVLPGEDIDGIKAADYAIYIATNLGYFLPLFRGFGKGKSVSINLCAFLFPSVYYFYRKMYSVGTLFFILELLACFGNAAFYFAAALHPDNQQLINLTYQISSVFAVVQFSLNFLSGLFGSWLYYKKARKEIKKQQAEQPSLLKSRVMIKKRGGVNYVAAIVSAALMFGLVTVGSYVMMLFL